MRGLDKALRVLFPRRAVCMGCGGLTGCAEDWICPDCRRALNENWIGAGPPPEGLDGAAYAYAYRDPAARVVRQLKYVGVSALAGFMARDMVMAYDFIAPTGADCVTCVPMHPRRLRRRGFNQAALLARDVAGRLELPFVEALRTVRPVRQQARLDGAARLQNLRDAFAAEGVAGRRVLLVDDVCTTGATARACARALRDAGAKNVYLLCYAKAGKQ